MSVVAPPVPSAATPTSLAGTRGRKWPSGVVLVGLVCGLGLVAQAYDGYQGRVSGNPSALLFWLSLIVMYITGVAVVLFDRRMTREARLAAVALLSLSIQATRVVLYPDMFTYHDELIHFRVLEDILAFHKLGTANSILPVTPHYAGLEIVTSAVANLTGLSPHTSGVILLLVARLIMTLGLYLVVARFTASERIAGAACLVYLANPQFLFFNSQFSYQTLALPLCFAFVYVVSISQTWPRRRAWTALVVCGLAAAVTHHLTSAGLAALLGVWSCVSLWTKRRPRDLFAATAIMVVCVAVWGLLGRHTIVPYLTEIARHNITSVQQLVSGHSDHKFFKDTAGDLTPVWERLVSLASVLVLVILLPIGLWRGRAWLRARHAPAIILGVIAAAYPVIPLGHLTNATSEVADRSSGFIFVGIAFVIAAWLFAPRSPIMRSRQVDGIRSFAAALTICGVAGILFVGGTVVGSGPPWLRAPGAYLVSSENRSVDPLAMAAAHWERVSIPSGKRVYTDRINGLLAEAVGNQHELTSLGDHVDNFAMSRLLLAPLSSLDFSTVRQTRLTFLIVDTRLATDLPHVGVYTDNGEYGDTDRTRPPSRDAVTKFDTVFGADRVYDNGAIRIYAVGGVR